MGELQDNNGINDSDKTVKSEKPHVFRALLNVPDANINVHSAAKFMIIYHATLYTGLFFI